jgi:hypothetical protein
MELSSLKIADYLIKRLALSPTLQKIILNLHGFTQRLPEEFKATWALKVKDSLTLS